MVKGIQQYDYYDKITGQYLNGFLKDAATAVLLITHRKNSWIQGPIH
jgi:hypothetical protein